MNQLSLKILASDKIDEIVTLVRQLNPNMQADTIKERQLQMFTYPNYHCFGFYKNEELIGLCSGWILVKIYSGKQLELDNVIINNAQQSKGYGKEFVDLLEQWAKNNDCKNVELNTYSTNTRSHKFYYNQGYDIRGFHFLKKL